MRPVCDYMPMEPVRKRSAGGIVIGDGGTVALVRNKNGPAWTFPKGHVDEGETDEEAARREIREETGLSDIELIDDLGSYERFRIGPNGDDDDTSELKEIHLYLFGAMPRAALAPSMEIEEAVWVPFREVAEKLSHAKDRAFYASVFDRVREGIQRD